MIEVQNLSKSYLRGNSEHVHVLHEVCFRVTRGEFVAVRGASGSGKSTLLNIVGCLDHPSTGSFRLDGEDVSTYSDKQLSRIRNSKIGFVFQSFNLLPRTTALENVEVPMVYCDGIVDRGRAIAALHRVGLAARARHYAAELSGGEQQRVAIARALINDPLLILADEPTGNLDAQAGREVLTLLQDLHAEGRTILLVTHDDAIAASASRELFLCDGKLLSDRVLSHADLPVSRETVQ